MRILQATEYYPPPVIGGRELQVQMLTRELRDRGHDVEVISLAGPMGPRTELDDGIRVHRVEGWTRYLGRFYGDRDRPVHPTVPDPGVVRALRTILRATGPAIVHAHSWLLYSLLPLLPTPDTKLVVWLHDYGLVCPKQSFIYQGGLCSGPNYLKCVGCASEQYGGIRSLATTTGLNMMKPWRGRVNRYVANSKATAVACSRYLSPEHGDMQIIPPFVADSAFQGKVYPRPSFVPQVADYLMFAGLLAPHKGIDVLLEAWLGLEKKIPLVLAGIRRPDTPREFPDGVILAEDVPHEDVLRAWRHCLAAIVPSRYPEPFGTVAVEAMAAGRPVIASAVGGLPDLVTDSVTGLLVPPGDPIALRRAMSQLIASPHRCDALGAEGRRRAVRYSARVAVGAWESVYNEVVGDGGADSKRPPGVSRR